MVDQSSDWLKLHCEGGNILVLLNEDLGSWAVIPRVVEGGNAAISSK